MGKPRHPPQCGEQTPAGSWDTLMDQSTPKTPCLPLVWHPEKEPRGPQAPWGGAAQCPQARPERRRSPQPQPPGKAATSFPSPDPKSIQSLGNKGLGASHAGAGSREFPKAAKPQRPNENSSRPINHTCPINHTLPINPNPAA